MNSKRKGSKKRNIIIIAAVATAGALAFVFAVPLFGAGTSVSAADITRIATVEKGTIETTVTGSGSVEAGSSLTLQIPAGVELDTLYVSAGDSILKGDAIAAADADSVMEAIRTVESELESIDSEIEDSADDTDKAQITATASGRVMQINGKEGDSAQQVVSSHDSLMVLSVDGLMNVSFTYSGELSIGDDVVVTLSDGTEKDGTVVSTANGTVTVTVSDKGPTVGETATIANEDGEQIGTGTLEISAPLEVVSGSGIIESIDVEVGDFVDQGDALVTLSETAATKNYTEVKNRRDKYADMLRQLYLLAENGTITADTNGTVSEVFMTATNTATSGDANQQGAENTAESPIEQKPPADMTATKENDLELTLLSVSTQPETSRNTMFLNNEQTQPGATLEEDPPPENTEPQQISEVAISLPAPASGQLLHTEITPTEGFSGTISWSPADVQVQDGTSYTAIVTLNTNDGYAFSADATVSIEGAQSPATIVQNTGSSLIFSVSYPASGNADTLGGSQQQSQSPSLGSSGGGSSFTASGGGASPGASMQATSSASSGTASDNNSASSNAGTEQSSLMQDVLTIASTESFSLTASVDELDILSLEVGQEATVVFDALPNEEFTGTVTKISETGTSQSGVTTYPTTITLDLPDGTAIKAGMNATATIVTNVSEDTLVIPMAAMQEMGGEQFVMLAPENTSAEEDEINLGERREITTGLSDGVSVEVLSGLEEGEAISYIETTSTDSAESGTAMMMPSGTDVQAAPPEGFSGGPPSGDFRPPQ